MINKDNDLPITRQCELLSLNRSTVYYRHQDVAEVDLKLMRRIDEMHLKRPFYGSRRIRDWLQDEGYDINRKRVQRLMRKMGIRALYPKPRTSKPGKGHKIYPYLLRDRKKRASDSDQTAFRYSLNPKSRTISTFLD